MSSGTEVVTTAAQVGLSDDDARDAIAWWFQRRLGQPHLVPGSPLAYEPRSAWGCSICHSVLVGVKSGHLYRIDPGTSPIALVHEFTSGIRAIKGCLNPACAGRTHEALAADIGGHVYRLVLTSGSHDVERVEGVALRGNAIAVRLIQWEDQRWGLAMTDAPGLEMVPLDGRAAPPRQEPLPRSVRWMLREGAVEASPPRGEYRWQVVAMDGNLWSARCSWDGGPQIRLFHIGRLREVPLSAAADRHGNFDRIRSILYGSHTGLRVAVLDEHGVRVERVLLPGTRIHYVRVVSIFSVPHLIACGEDGKVWSRPWDNPEETREVDWLEWPAMPSDVMFVEAAGAPDPAGVEHPALLVLRDHRVYRLSLYNRRIVKERLRAIPTGQWDRLGPPDDPAWDGDRWRDAKAFAQLVGSPEPPRMEHLRQLARDGGERTLKGLADRLTRYPALTLDVAIEISITVLLSAVRFGYQTVRSLAQRLHGQLLNLLRDTPETDATAPEFRPRLEKWVVFLKKHYMLASTFSEKRANLRSLIAFNRTRETPDALIYEARLRAQGFDLEWESEESWPSRVMALHASDRSPAEVAVSLGNGSLVRVTLDSPRGVHPVRAIDSAHGRPFGNYSRVVQVAQVSGQEAWLCAPKSAAQPGAPVVMPKWKPAGKALPQVYSLHRVSDNEVLLGLRDLKEPLAIWDLRTGEARCLEVAFGTAVHRGAIQEGERRISMLTGISRDVVAVGAEDGFLRVGRYASGRFKLFSDKDEFLGTPLRAAAYWQDPSAPARQFLIVGTDRGEVFCFAVQFDKDGTPGLTLKFRDVLIHSVVSIFIMHPWPGNPQICVLDEAGRLTTYDLRNERGFLGRRSDQYQVGEEATAAAPVGEGRVVVAGWDRARRRSRLRLLRFDEKGTSLRALRDPGLLDQARASVAGLELKADAIDVLASFPLDDPSLRAALVADRLPPNWKKDRLESLYRDALGAYAGNRLEIKALLDAVAMQLRNGLITDDQFAAVFELFIAPRDRDDPADPRLQAAILRRLLTLPTLRRWRSQQPEHALGSWVDRHLHHAERVVRVETLRALSEALLELLRMKNKPEKRADFEQAFAEAFPSTDGFPVASTNWLLSTITDYLSAHPALVHGSECDASTWAAVSVLVNLLRLMPDAALVILDHLSIKGVEPPVFGVLKRRLTNQEDKVSLGKLNQYMPWLDHDPTIVELRDHCKHFLSEDKIAEKKRDLKIEPGTPDEAFWAAYVTCYQWLGKMALATTEAWLEDLKKEVRNERERLKLEGRKRLVADRPDWSKALWDDRHCFMQYTERWIRGVAFDLLEGPARKKIAAEHQRLAQVGGSTDPRAAILFAPEIGIARTILAHWQYVLDPPLPRKGDAFGGYQLDEPLSEWVFKVVGYPDRVIRVADVLFGDEAGDARRAGASEDGRARLARDEGRDPAAALARAWQKIARISQDREIGLVPVIDVVTSEPRPGLVMTYVDGQDIHQHWNDFWSLPVPQRFHFAFRCMVDIGQALKKMHAHDLFHGDVQASNILWNGASERFLLLDFDRSGDKATLEAEFGESGQGRNADYSLRLVKVKRSSEKGAESRSEYLQKCDAAGLFETVIAMVTAKPFDEFPLELAAAWDELPVPGEVHEWSQSLVKRWNERHSASWSAADLLSEAVETGQGVYVAGATEDTDAIRDELARHLEGATDWFVQGTLNPTAEPIVPQLIARLRRSKYVIHLIGETPGTEVPEDQVPVAATKEVAKPDYKWPSGGRLTYTQCEYALARAFTKRVLCFRVGDREPTEPRQRALLAHALQLGPVPMIRSGDCVSIVQQRLVDERKRKKT